MNESIHADKAESESLADLAVSTSSVASPASQDALCSVVADVPTVEERPYSIFYIDDCMYVAAMSKADAVAYVKAEYGDDCADSDWIREASLGFMVETANVEDGEEPTPTSKKTARELVDEHLASGGTLPWTVAFDAGL